MEEKTVDKRGNVFIFNKEGFIHNTKGPAVIWNDGTEWYYLKGVRMDYELWFEARYKS